MPELPEVETMRRALEKEVVGKRVKSVDVKTMKVVDRHPNKKHFQQQLEGAKLKSLIRKGQHLLFTLDNEMVLVVELGAAGQLRKQPSKDALDPNTHIVITFTQGGDLRFVDAKSQGNLFLVPADELDEQVPELAALGLDVVDTPVSWTQFARTVVDQGTTKLKSFLVDQSIIAGLGPVYSDEILFQAGLRYDRECGSLSTQEIRRLYRSLVETLHDAIKHGGSSVEQEPYADLHGDSGGFQAFHEVYGRDGEPCRRCRGEITKAKFAGRNVYFCPQCQV